MYTTDTSEVCEINSIHLYWMCLRCSYHVHLMLFNSKFPDHYESANIQLSRFIEV